MYNGMDGFDWDEWNRNKNWISHKVTFRECEEVFFDKHVVVYEDTKHSTNEKRFGILSKTANDRLLHINFTVKEHKIRVISARDMNRKERKHYEETK